MDYSLRMMVMVFVVSSSVLILILMDYSLRVLEVMSKGGHICLNPYSNGLLSEALVVIVVVNMFAS